MAKFPKIKKEISAFLAGEDGKISKQALLKAGVIVGTIAVTSSLLSADAQAEQSNPNCCEAPSGGVCHANSLALSYNEAGGTATGTHGHCVGSHSNHANHTNHGNHGNHGNCTPW